MELGVIYCLTSPSGKMYVGQSWNIQDRFSRYKYIRCKRQPKLYNALKKYGPKTFKFEIIDYCDNQIEMDNKEIWYIEEYNCIKNGYNCRTGGSHGLFDEAAKKRISIRVKKWWNMVVRDDELHERYVKQGKMSKGKMSKENRQKLSHRMKTTPAWNKGTKQVESHTNNIKIAMNIPKEKENNFKKNIKFKYVFTNIITNKKYQTYSLREFCEVFSNISRTHINRYINKQIAYKNEWLIEKTTLDTFSIIVIQSQDFHQIKMKEI